jgi:ubiquinone/menaquinone biosynthesis C-methylase UbiE
MIDQNELKNWYDREYAKNPRRFTRDAKCYRPFLRYLSPKPGKKLLDVACGTGLFLKLAGDLGLETYGLDLSETAVRIAGKAVPHAKIRVGNGEALPFEDKQFDYVSNIGSLEHYLDQAKGIKEMIRVLKDDGKMLIVLPNSFWEMHKGTGQKHEVLNTIKAWSELLTANGLNILQIHKDPGPAIFHDLKLHKVVLRSMGKLVTILMPVAFAYQFVFICEPARGETAA